MDEKGRGGQKRRGRVGADFDTVFPKDGDPRQQGGGPRPGRTPQGPGHQGDGQERQEAKTPEHPPDVQQEGPGGDGGSFHGKPPQGQGQHRGQHRAVVFKKIPIGNALPGPGPGRVDVLEFVGVESSDPGAPAFGDKGENDQRGRDGGGQGESGNSPEGGHALRILGFHPSPGNRRFPEPLPARFNARVSEGGVGPSAAAECFSFSVAGGIRRGQNGVGLGKGMVPTEILTDQGVYMNEDVVETIHGKVLPADGLSLCRSR